MVVGAGEEVETGAGEVGLGEGGGGEAALDRGGAEDRGGAAGEGGMQRRILRMKVRRVRIRARIRRQVGRRGVGTGGEKRAALMRKVAAWSVRIPQRRKGKVAIPVRKMRKKRHAAPCLERIVGPQEKRGVKEGGTEGGAGHDRGIRIRGCRSSTPSMVSRARPRSG